MGLKESLRELIPEEKRKDADALFEKLDEQMSGYDADIKELKKQLRSKDGVKPEDLAALEKELEETKAARQKAEADLKKLSRDYETEKAARTELEGSVNRTLAETEIRRELSGYKLSGDKLEELVEGYIPRVIVKAENGSRTALIGDKPVKDYFKTWAETRGKAFIEAPVSSGSGASGGDGKPSGKSISRAEFDALDPTARMEFSKGGGKLTD